jgi:hypothetical protein
MSRPMLFTINMVVSGYSIISKERYIMSKNVGAVMLTVLGLAATPVFAESDYCKQLKVDAANAQVAADVAYESMVYACTNSNAYYCAVASQDWSNKQSKADELASEAASC